MRNASSSKFPVFRLAKDVGVITLDDLNRQLRLALIAISIVLPISIIGFMYFENLTFLQAVWVTFITLTTVGYGDLTAKTDVGKIFTICIILVGLGSLAFALQASFTWLASPALRQMRQRRLMQGKIDKLANHYIICGVGELVDRTINYLMDRSELRRQQQEEVAYKPIDRILDRIFGDDEDGYYVGLHNFVRSIIVFFVRPFLRRDTFLDVLVVVTHDNRYADHLRDSNILVVEGDSTNDRVLRQAGVTRAQAIMVMLDNDTEALLTVLTANKLNPAIYGTGALLEEDLRKQMLRVGANSVIAPYEVAGQFLNNATLRPMVNDFYDHLISERAHTDQVTQIHLWDDSPWIGKTLHELKLRERFHAGVIGMLSDETSTYVYVPDQNTLLTEGTVLITVLPPYQVPLIHQDCHPHGKQRKYIPTWQPIPVNIDPPSSTKTYSLMEVNEAVKSMSNHFVVCGAGRVVRNSLNKLDPSRPFVVITDDNGMTSELMKRGFRVIHGDPTKEETLRKGGVDRAQGIMISIEDKADATLTVLMSRGLSKRLLITATASDDDMIEKLRRAGADRIINPFHVAAQTVLLATTRPIISDFVQHILYNYHTGLETAEFYMEDSSRWIGKQVAELDIERYDARVIGIRRADKRFIYAPDKEYVIQAHEVLLTVNPMRYYDTLRAIAHGSETKRPSTLRQQEDMTSGVWSQEKIKAILREQGLAKD